MKSFEEQFPSLKGRELHMHYDSFEGSEWLCDDQGCSDYKRNPIEELLKMSDIRKHCLDKQRVKETIIKVRSQGNCTASMRLLMHELGLEE
jgi:hypothetical protein